MYVCVVLVILVGRRPDGDLVSCFFAYLLKCIVGCCPFSFPILGGVYYHCVHMLLCLCYCLIDFVFIVCLNCLTLARP